MTTVMNTDAKIDYAEQQCRKAGLSATQTARVQGYLLGATLTHLDTVPLTPMSDSRWRRLVHAALEEWVK